MKMMNTFCTLAKVMQELCVFSSDLCFSYRQYICKSNVTSKQEYAFSIKTLIILVNSTGKFPKSVLAPSGSLVPLLTSPRLRTHLTPNADFCLSAPQ